MRVAFLHLTEMMGWPAERVVVMGRSLGSGPASRLAREFCPGVTSNNNTPTVFMFRAVWMRAAQQYGAPITITVVVLVLLFNIPLDHYFVFNNLVLYLCEVFLVFVSVVNCYVFLFFQLGVFFAIASISLDPVVTNCRGAHRPPPQQTEGPKEES